MSTTGTAQGARLAPASSETLTRAELTCQLRRLAADLPWFALSPLVRARHLTWGATPAEVAADMPGDALLPHAQYRSTRAITICATPSQVWPWLVQVGCHRAGWYAHDLLDNFGRPSATRILPELQHLEVGQWLPMTPHPSSRRSFVVHGFSAPEWLLWTTPIRTWSWRLVALSGERTRLTSRLRTTYRWPAPASLLTLLLMEFADFPMMRSMLRGIRDRAEADSSQASTLPTPRGR